MIKWGIIGVGEIAYHVGFAIQSLADCKIEAVTSRRKEPTKQFAERLKIPTVCASFEEMLELSTIDVVYIATPNSLHADMIESCLRQGKHVLCEKPIVTDSARLIELQKLAHDQQLFLMEAMWTMFIPSIQYLLKIVHQHVGNIKMIQGSMGFMLSKERCFSKELGGGSIWDLGVYLITLTHAILGVPNSVKAQGISSKGDVETTATIHLNYDNAIAGLCCSFDTELENTFAIFGDKGTLKIENPFYRSSLLSLKTNGLADSKESAIRNPFDANFLLKNGASWKQRIYHVSGMGAQKKVIPFQGNGYQYQIAEVVNCIKNKMPESTVMPIKDNIQIIRIIENLYKNKK